MKMSISLLMGILICLSISNCKPSLQKEEIDSHPTEMTHWTEEFEIFSEFEVQEPSHVIKGIVHVTLLKDFSPLNSGELLMTFLNEKNNKTEGERRQCPSLSSTTSR